MLSEEVHADLPEAEQLSTLVAAIYDAALTPDNWPAVLLACRNFVGGMAAAIFAKDAAGLRFQIYHQDGGIAPAQGMLYAERYQRLDPATQGHLFTEIDQPVSTGDLMDVDEFRASRFFREWSAPLGIADFISAPIEKSGGWAAMFGVFLPDSHGLATAETHRRMRLIVPHVRRAVLVGKVIERDRQQAASLEDTFDGLAAAMVLVDAQGRVVHANTAARAMAGGSISVRQGALVVDDRAVSAALKDIFAFSSEGDAAVGDRGISLALAAPDGEHYAAHVLPLSSGERRRAGARYSAVAALFVQHQAIDGPAAPELIARTYGLTLTELRVLVAIVQVGGVPETAVALGIAETTVKTHLHRVYSKTGTSRQAELVRLVARFSSPLAH
jgi:DNA-binding CsgD family transcriptional regulator/PAS domain-containing protein